MAENFINEEFKLRNSLRKMIKSFDTFINEAEDYEQLEDNLKHMEETDENFHKYDLVEIITDKIICLLGNSINKNVNTVFNSSNNNKNDENKFDGDIGIQNKMAQRISEEIMKTKEFLDFKSNFKNSILKANEYLIRNFHSNFIENQSEDITTINENENKSITFTNDFDYSSPNNSMNQNSFVFLTSDQFPIIAQNLDPKKPDQIRLKAIQQLLSIPASDPQAADHWIDIRNYLNNCLKDPNENISELCLKLHSRTLASSHYRVSIELFINITEHLCEYFRDIEFEKRLLKANIDLTLPANILIFKKFRLINDYSKDIITKWARYPQEFIEKIINQTLKLFSITCDQKLETFMTPIHYISLLDIQSNWFGRWMHGNDSRKVLIDSIKKNEIFLQASINSIFFFQKKTPADINSNEHTTSFASSISSANFSSLHRKKSANNNHINNIENFKRFFLKKSEIEYAHFIHSLNVIRKILCFRNGRRLFPVKIQNKEFSIKDLIKVIIQIIFESNILYKDNNEFSPSKYAYDLLQDLCITEDTCEACLCNEDVIEQLIKPLKTIIQPNKNNLSNEAHTSTSTSLNYNVSVPNVYSENYMIIIANVLSKIASTECGYRQLLYNDSKINFSINKNFTAAHTIVSFVQKALTNKLNYNVSTPEIAEYLYLARLLYSKCQGVFLIKEYNLNKFISESWNLVKSDKEASILEIEIRAINLFNYNSSKKNLTLSWSDALLDNLVVMASTPKGVFFLNESGLIKEVINYMFTRYKAKLQVGKYEKFGYGFIISQLSNTSSGCFYFNESLFIQYLIDEIWIELECGSDDFMSAFPRSHSVEPIDREVYKPMLCLMNMTSSFSAAFELLYDASVTPRQQYNVKDIPKGLIGLLDRIVFIDKKIKLSSLYNFEQSHLFGLRFLNYLICDLDVLLLIESQYNSTSLLLNLQKSNRPNNIDMNNLEQYDTSSENNQIKNKNNIIESNIIIDMLSVERNYVLVCLNLIGGPTEKLLPDRTSSDNKYYNCPLFDSLPIPDFYVKKKSNNAISIDHSFKNFVMSFNFESIINNEESKTEWLKNIKINFYNSIKSSQSVIEIMPTAINQMILVLTENKMNCFDKANNIRNFDEILLNSESFILKTELSNLQILGIEKTIEYGLQINQLDCSSISKNDYLKRLAESHKFVKFLVSSDFKNKSESKQLNPNSFLNYCQEEYFPSYDWFLSTIFMMYKGDYDSTLSFMFNFHSLKLSSLLWPARFYCSQKLHSNIYNQNGISVLLTTTCHYIEHILKIELPLIYSAFRMSGLAPSHICLHWLKQCFWNYLDWNDIIIYLSICIIFGIDFQTYFCIAVLKHLNESPQNVFQHHTYKDLQIYLKESQINNFKIGNHIDYLFELERKYRQYILVDIKDTLY